jgi:hypothetical protein
MMEDLRKQAKEGMAKKLASYGGKSTGTSFNDKGHWGSASSPVDSAQINRKPEGSDEAKAVRLAKDGGSVKRLDRKPRKSGGRVHSDEAADKALVNKMVKPECRTKRAEGGGISKEELAAKYAATAEKEKNTPREKIQEDVNKWLDSRGNFKELVEMGKKNGGRAERADGGRVGKGKATTVNIVIGKTAPDDSAMMPPPRPAMAPPAPPPPPAAPMGAPMGAAPPMGIGAAPGMPPMMPRKKGGRITSPADLTAGAMSGEGRLQKVSLQRAAK